MEIGIVRNSEEKSNPSESPEHAEVDLSHERRWLILYAGVLGMFGIWVVLLYALKQTFS